MMVYCPKCENECSEEAKVCPKCGHPLRSRRRPRAWMLVVAVVVMVLGFGIYGGVAGWWGSLSSGSGGLTFAEAMRLAESKTNVTVMEAPRAQRALGHRSAEDLQKGEERYRKFLSAGEPIIMPGPFRGITVAFTQQLPDAHREAWLGDCMRVVEAGEAPRGVVQRLGEKHGFEHAGYHLRWGPEWSLEAIFNLTENGELKAEALARWNKLVRSRYEARLDTYEDWTRRRRTGERGLVIGDRPRLETMPIWDEEK